MTTGPGLVGPLETVGTRDPCSSSAASEVSQKPKDLKKCKGIISKVPVPLTVSRGRSGRAGVGFAPDLPDSNGDDSQGPNFPDLAKHFAHVVTGTSKVSCRRNFDRGLQISWEK
jgi:hypothetical protein